MKKLRVIVCLVFVLSCGLFAAWQIRTRMTADRIAPVISCDSDTLTVSVDVTEEELMQGVTARDDKDGDLTADVRIVSLSRLSPKGTRTVRYIVFDKANNAGSLERTLTYSDYTPPRIYTSDPLRYTVAELDAGKILAHFRVEDCLDEDLTGHLRLSFLEGYGEPGKYEASVMVNNSAGDVCSLVMEMQVVDDALQDERRQIYPALSEYIVYTKVGQNMDPHAYLTGVEQAGVQMPFSAEEGIAASDITVQSSVDVSQPGIYPVKYLYTSPEGRAAETFMYVVVEE